MSNHLPESSHGFASDLSAGVVSPTPLDLVTWLREQIAADERSARADMRLIESRQGSIGVGPVAKAIRIEDTTYLSGRDPARALREVEAKRRRLERHQPCIYDDIDASCDHCEETGDERWPCEELRLDLAVYADRPGYREEWRP